MDYPIRDEYATEGRKRATAHEGTPLAVEVRRLTEQVDDLFKTVERLKAELEAQALRHEALAVSVFGPRVER